MHNVAFFRCRRWYAVRLPFCDVVVLSLSLSLFFRCARHQRQEREGEKEREGERERERERKLATNIVRSRARHNVATHTTTLSINRCVCCFNLPWARVTSGQRAISATRKSLRNVPQSDIGATFS